VAADFFFCEVGAVEVCAGDSGEAAGGVGARAFEGLAGLEEGEDLIVSCDGVGGDEGGGAVARVGGDDGSEGLLCAVHKVCACAAVDVHVDEAGGGVGALGVEGLAGEGGEVGGAAHRSDAAVFDVEGGAFEEAVGEDEGGVGDAEGHGS
jgi:hypothetical protein